MRLPLADRLFDHIINWLMRDYQPITFPLNDFHRLRYELKPCDVLLFEGRSRVSEVIKIITLSPWSHAALYIGHLYDIENKLLRERVKQFYKGDEDAHLIIESLLGQGTIASPLANYKDDHIRICRPQGISQQDAQQVIAYAIGKLGVEYDVRQIVDLARFLFPWSVLPRQWRSSLFKHNAGGPIREICSSLLAEAFDSVKFPILPIVSKKPEKGLELIPRNTRLFTPSDFDYSPYFEIIKCPIFDMSAKGAHYRNLPWNKEGLYSNDKVGKYTPYSPDDLSLNDPDGDQTDKPKVVGLPIYNKSGKGEN